MSIKNSKVLVTTSATNITSGSRTMEYTLAKAMGVNLVSIQSLSGMPDIRSVGLPWGGVLHHVTGNLAAITQLEPDYLIVGGLNPDYMNNLDMFTKMCSVIQRVDVNPIEFDLIGNSTNYLTFRRALAQAHLVVAHSEYSQRVCRALGVHARIIRNGVFLDEFESPGLEARSKDVLIVARTSPVKNFLVPILGFRKVMREVPEARLIIIATGNIGKLKKWVQALGMTHSIEIQGQQPLEKIKKLYAHSRVFVHPSLSENCPMVLLESLASGLPLLLSSCGGHREFTSAEFFVHDDPNDFAEKLLPLLQDDELWQKKAKEVMQERKNYDIKQKAKEYWGLISKLYDLRKKMVIVN